MMYERKVITLQWSGKKVGRLLNGTVPGYWVKLNGILKDENFPNE